MIVPRTPLSRSSRAGSRDSIHPLQPICIILSATVPILVWGTMVRRRRTRKQWHEYHREKAKLEGRAKIEAEHGEEIASLKSVRDEALEAFESALREEPMSSRVWVFFDFDSEYRKRTLEPLKADLDIADRALADASSAIERYKSRPKSSQLEATRQHALNEKLKRSSERRG